MAENNSAGAVFVELGLDLTKLDSDFIAADETIQQNLSRLNRERNLIELRAQVEIGGLDAAADAEKIFEVQTRALTQQIEIQRDKVMLIEAAFQQLSNTQGANAAATQNMESRLNRETLALQKLETQLQQLQGNLQKVQTSTTTTAAAIDNAGKKFSNFFSSAFSDKINELAERFPLLSGFAEKATTALSGFSEKAVTALSAVPTPAKAAAVALLVIPAAAKAAESAILSLAEPAIQAGDAFYVMSRGMQMSIQDMGELSMICKVTGIELSEVTTVMRRLNMQIVRGGESGAEKALKRFGVEVRNTNGELKNALEMSLALADGLERAQKNGRGKEFIAGILGRNASGDIVTFLEDLKGNVELARTVVKNGLFDPARAHNVQGLINTMNTQAAQLGSTFSSALIPVAEKIVPAITKRMGELTKVIQDNASGIKNLGEAFANLAEVGEAAITTIAKGGIKILGGIGDLFLGRENSFVEKYLNDKDIQSAEDLMKKHMQNYYSPQDRWAIENNPAMYQTTLSQFKDYFKAIEDARKTSIKSWADFRREEENSLKAAVKFTDEELEESKQRVEKIKEEIEDLKIELDSGNDYEKSIAKLDLQLKRADIDNKPEEEQAAIKERHALRLQQITKEFEEVEKSFNEKILELNNTALEQRLANIEKEKQAWIQKGIDEVKATQWAEQAKVDAQRNAALALISSQKEAWQAFKAGGYDALKQYHLHKLYDAGIYPEDLEITPKQLADFEKMNQAAQRALLPNFMTDFDRDFTNRMKDYSDSIDRLNDRAKDNQNLPNDTLNDDFAELPQSLEEAISGFDGLTVATDNLQQKFNDFAISETPEVPTPTKPQETKPLELPEFDTTQLENAFNDLQSMIEGVSNSFDEMTPQLEEITSAYADLVESVQKVNSEMDKLNLQQNNQPTNITNNVSIQEAHAWDYSHIQQLAEKVADVIAPKILTALGGNSNSY